MEPTKGVERYVQWGAYKVRRGVSRGLSSVRHPPSFPSPPPAPKGRLGPVPLLCKDVVGCGSGLKPPRNVPLKIHGSRGTLPQLTQSETQTERQTERRTKEGGRVRERGVLLFLSVDKCIVKI